MKILEHNKLRSIGLTVLSLVIAGTVAISPLAAGVANAVSGTTTAASQARLAVIIAKGDQEITRRLATLSTLVAKINAATKLTASDQASLTAEVNSTISGLTILKTQLDTETTLEAARADVTNIYSEYRVYALVAPKVALIKVADDQQTVETKLIALAQKLQTRITTDQQAGKDVTSLQAQLNDMTTNANSAQTISASVQSSVINLQPTDFNSDHAILSGYRDKLKAAHVSNQTAYADAKTIIAGLKAL